MKAALRADYPDIRRGFVRFVLKKPADFNLTDA